MIPETFFEQFATFAEAPNGIAKLRELILQLAVQGKLVPQDENDEPASVLAEQIVEYRKATNGRAASIDLLTSDELGFPLPSGWIAARFGDLMVNRDGERVPVSREIREGRKGPYDYYGASGVIDCIDEFLFDKPLLLIGEDGANLINRSTPIAFIAQGKYWVNNHAHVLDGISLDFLRYIELHINAIDLKPFVTGTAQPKMNQAKMNSIPIALPPLAEQRRIVGKVDQLLGLCDELAVRQAAQREARSALVRATLDRLVSPRRQPNSSSPSPQSSGERGAGGEGVNRLKRRPPHSQPFSAESDGEGSKDMDINRLRDHFDRLFDTPTTIPKLRQAILQLAVQGQLVPQDPNDEPASCLIQRANSLRTDILKSLDVRGGASEIETVLKDTEYALPHGWELARIGNIAVIRGGKRLPKGVPFSSVATPYVYIRVTDMKDQTVAMNDLQYIDEATHRLLQRYVIDLSDLYVVIVGATIGKVGRVPELLSGMHLTENAARLVFREFDQEFLLLALRSQTVQSQFVAKTYQQAQPKLALNRIESTLIQVPPLSEQKRIVSKVTELLSLCDALEAKLTQAESASSQLLSASVHHLLKRL